MLEIVLYAEDIHAARNFSAIDHLFREWNCPKALNPS
jgi:hypothetical protein